MNRAGKPHDPLPTVIPDRPPLAEELLCLDFVREWKATEAKPFPLIADIDAGLAPHQGATARSVCERFGWLVRAQATRQVPSGARMVSQAGKDVMREVKFATEDLLKRIREAEAKHKMFGGELQHTDIPKLGALRLWLVGDEKKAPAQQEPPKPSGKRRPAMAATVPEQP